MRKLFVLAALLLAGCGAFVSDDDTIHAVEKQGYSDVSVVESHIFFVKWRGCSASDDALYEMNATNARGARVRILACAGWPFKGVTIRTE